MSELLLKLAELFTKNLDRLREPRNLPGQRYHLNTQLIPALVSTASNNLLFPKCSRYPFTFGLLSLAGHGVIEIFHLTVAAVSIVVLVKGATLKKYVMCVWGDMRGLSCFNGTVGSRSCFYMS